MKKLLFSLSIVLLIFSAVEANAQLKDLDKRIENKVKRRIDQKADRTIDKALDKGENKIDQEISETAKNDKKDKGKGNSKTENGRFADTNNKGTITSEEENTPYVNHSSDFVPGERTLFSETFEKDAEHDFPAAWNTTGSGEVVTFSNVPGKWLSIPHNTLTYPEHVATMPENFTVEFDLLIPKESRPPITFGFSESNDPVKEGIRTKKLFYFQVDNAQDYIESSSTFYVGQGNSKPFAASKLAGKPIRVGISINKTRIRLYMNDEKIFDLPRAFEPAALRNSFFFRAAPIIPEKGSFYISNIRISESGTDARSSIIKELMEKGSVSTNDIQFDFNSDKIKPSSHETLGLFGEALKQNPGMRLRIVGHTDNVGKDEYNRQLSAKRATAVKNYLMQHYGIDANRVETEGKGSASPAVPNDTEEGRAKNRRVEFIKL